MATVLTRTQGQPCVGHTEIVSMTSIVGEFTEKIKQKQIIVQQNHKIVFVGVHSVSQNFPD